MTNWKEIDSNGVDEFNYCLWWIGVKISQTVLKIITTTSIIMLNGLISQLLARLSKFKKRHTTISE